MTALPTGTLTFLFTDIEGSTRLVQRLGSDYRRALADHNSLMREAFVADGGIEVRAEGDSFFVVFSTASRGLQAAARAQGLITHHEWPSATDLRVRMGMHTGEGTLGGDNYYGLDVHRAARISAVANGGQVLLSEATRLLAASGDLGFLDVGVHRLKDLVVPEHLYQLTGAGLPADFPPIVSLDQTPNNLPDQLTEFVGRHAEVERIRELAEQTRLLTLTGPGGTGKTRLSLQVGTRSIGRFPDGVFFVDLSPVTDPQLVADSIATALGLTQSQVSPFDRVLSYLEGRRALLILDNFEQVLAARDRIAELVSSLPQLTLLVTSRAPLHISGEQEYPVQPLSTPSGNGSATPEAVADSEAGRLFLIRAKAAKPDFVLTAENAPAVSAISRRLDGLPLALELAAARIKTFSPSTLLSRLEHGLGFLAHGPENRPSRQQTLSNAISWSYDLLTEPERTVFGQFSVFSGSAALEDIESVCDAGAAHDLLDVVASLVDQSLVHRDDLESADRFRMLDTIRQYAAERLEMSGMAPEVRTRHAELYAGTVRGASKALIGTNQGPWLRRLDLDYDNIRSALDWSLSEREGEVAQTLVGGMWRYWQMRGRLEEGRRGAEAALALPGTEVVTRCAALEGAGGIAYWQGDLTAAAVFYSEWLELARATGDRQGEADALFNFASTAYPGIEARLELLAPAEAAYAAIGDPVGLAWVRWAKGDAINSSGDRQQAARILDDSIESFRRLGQPFGLGWALFIRATVALAENDPHTSGSLLREGLALLGTSGDTSALLFFLTALIGVEVAVGTMERAATLAGAMERLRSTTGTNLLELALNDIEGLREAVERAGAEQFERHFRAGAAMSITEVVAYALGR
jgi:predicted ATPase/class 3 adenylate cyclase